jgi:hypothetical protein
VEGTAAKGVLALARLEVVTVGGVVFEIDGGVVDGLEVSEDTAVVVVGALGVVIEEEFVLSGELTILECEFCFVNGDSLFIGELEEVEDKLEVGG